MYCFLVPDTPWSFGLPVHMSHKKTTPKARQTSYKRGKRSRCTHSEARSSLIFSSQICIFTCVCVEYKSRSGTQHVAACHLIVGKPDLTTSIKQHSLSMTLVLAMCGLGIAGGHHMTPDIPSCSIWSGMTMLDFQASLPPVLHTVAAAQRAFTFSTLRRFHK